MNRRTRKKVWKKQTTEQQADLLDRVVALEELTRSMAAEQTAQRERAEDVQNDLELYIEAHAKRHAVEDKRRIRQERIRMEREMESRKKRQEWAKLGALTAFAVSFLRFALMMPAPEVAEPVPTAAPVAVMAEPAEGVVKAMAMNWED